MESAMNNYAAWIAGLLMGVLGVIGLVMAAAATDGAFTLAGLGFFAFAVLFIFGLIRRHVGHHQP